MPSIDAAAVTAVVSCCWCCCLVVVVAIAVLLLFSTRNEEARRTTSLPLVSHVIVYLRFVPHPLPLSCNSSATKRYPLFYPLLAFCACPQVLYVLPLQATSLMAYKRLLYAMMLVNALGLYGRHGRLRFNTEV